MADHIYYTDQQLVQNPADQDMGQGDFQIAEHKFMHFVRECQVRNVYIYREQLKSNAQREKYFLKVDMEHLVAFDDPLVTLFRNNPTDYIKVFESAVQTIYRNDFYDEAEGMDPNLKFQVQIHSDENPLNLRDLKSNCIGKVVVIPGIITSTSKTAVRARNAVYECSNCGN